MAINTQYDLVDLLEVIEVQDDITPLWLRYFPRVQQFDGAQIMFDQVMGGDRRLAPFVAPNVQGRVMRDRGYTTKTFTPAYLKPKHVVDPSRALHRRAGEKLLGSLTPQQRFDAIVAENLATEKKVIQNRLEWMAAMAVIYGKVTVAGDDYPTVEVDFGRDPSLTGTLAGTARWGQADANPLADLSLMRKRVQKLSKSSITSVKFGLDAWDLFTEDPKVRALLDKNTRGSDTEFNRALAEGTPYEFRGRISGQNGIGALDLWTYSDTYEDEQGNEIDLLDPMDVVGVGAGLQGVRAFGAILDKGAQLQSLEMFPKVWDQEDPAVTYTMTQSAPLMIPAQPNASFRLKVA